MSPYRVVVTGGAGFIGSHLCEQLVNSGADVVCVDNFATGSADNVEGLLDRPNFTLIETDVSEGLPVDGPVDSVLHFASPASPVDYVELGIETLLVGSAGTRHCLDLAESRGARCILASTSEVYGDPLEHPQTESYWGNVNPIGPRSVYDEAKRFAEALTMAYHRSRGVDVGVARIFNTYGPRMRPNDGRVVSNFIVQALSNRPLSIYGDGSQTRSFCYVDDLVAGILALLRSDLVGPVNLGNPNELTMLELANVILEVTGSASTLDHRPIPQDDPTQRCPDISLARRALGWNPGIDLATGAARTARYFAHHLETLP
jgi:nucleoside-diphosphate-sugar epimerase